MIAVDRNRRDVNGCRIWPGQSWSERAISATEEVKIGASCGGYKCRPDIYGSDSVRSALKELLFSKCAYCESSVVGGDMDVEHYRPKAGISEVSEHCGYYLLAYDWNNLLGSCPFCNRLRSERAMWPSKSRGGTSGKGSAFPLMHEQFRAWSPDDDVSLEYPLIINPAIDDPVDHIAYDPLGHAIGLTKKGETSIRILGLNARRLLHSTR